MFKFIQWLIEQEWLMRRLNWLFGLFNPFLPGYRRSPYETLARLREEAPMYYSRPFGAWLATRYEDAHFVLRDDNFTTDRSDTAIFKVIGFLARRDPDLTAMLDRNLLMLDGDEHRLLRGLVSKAFTPRRVEALRPKIQSVVDELLEEMREKSERGDEVELMRDLAQPMPIRVIMELMGFPRKDRQRLSDWSGHLVQLLDPLQAKGGMAPMRNAIRELNSYLRPLLASRRETPKDDLLSAMLRAEQDGMHLEERDLLTLVTLILVAGHETTTNLIGNSVIELFRNPGERKRLQDDPGLMPGAVDEFLRYCGSILMTDRAAIKDCEVGGQKIKAGQLVAVMLAAANRDPEKFEDPETLDVTRENNHHLSLGQGNHFCMGAQLAKLETEIAINSLLQHFPEFSGPSEGALYTRSMILRGPQAVPLDLGPSAKPLEQAGAQ
jgi:cytochrome P450